LKQALGDATIMGGKCKSDGGIKVEDLFGGTRIGDHEKKKGRDRRGKPNSRADLYPDKDHQGIMDRITSRWYDENGWAKNDRDYTDHGFPDDHKIVPHDHPFRYNKKTEKPERQKRGVEPNPEFCS
jgi:hypothetical protein